MSTRFQSRIYRSYSFGSMLSFGTRRRVSAFGWLILLGLPSVGFLSAMYPRDTLFRLLGLLTALLIVAFLSVLVRKQKLQVRRSVPAYATVGERVEYPVEYTNIGKLALRNFYLIEMAPDPRPSEELFLNSTEPGEELRNKFDQKFLAYRWMWMLRRRVLLKSEPTLAKPVAAGETQVVKLSFLPLRRGIIHLETLQATLPDALGIFQRVSRVKQVRDVVTVLPKRYAFDGLQFDGSSKSQLGGDAASSHSGQSGEFVSLREYRPGDPLKHIHWPSWGKAGKPIIKEYEEVFFPRYGLVLDTAVAAEQEAVFEEAISIAATFTCAVDTEESLLDLMFVQQGARVHTVGKNVERVDKMLEVLASLDMETSPDWQALSRMVVRHADELTTCIVVLCAWDEEREKLVNRLAASGAELTVLLVRDESGAFVGDVSSCPVPLVSIYVGKVEQGLASLSAG